MSERVRKTKGLQVIGLVQLLKGAPERARELLPSELHHYLGDSIQLTAWYPESDQEQLMRATAELAVELGIVTGDPWTAMGEEGAKSHLGGPYASLVRTGNPMRTLQSAPNAWELFHDSGRMVVKPTGLRTARIELHDFPVRPEMARLIGGYLCQLLRMAGGTTPKVAVVSSSDNEDRPTVWNASWM